MLSTNRRKIQPSPHHSAVTICESDKVWTLQTTVADFISFPVALHPHDDPITLLYTLEAFKAIKVALQCDRNNLLPFCGAWEPQSPEPGNSFLSLLCLSSHGKKFPFKIQILVSQRQHKPAFWSEARGEFTNTKGSILHRGTFTQGDVSFLPCSEREILTVLPNLPHPNSLAIQDPVYVRPLLTQAPGCWWPSQVNMLQHHLGTHWPALAVQAWC